MYVIISNKYRAMLASLDIEVMKAINGEFEVDEIISMFSNFYYQMMILDITAIKNYKDIRTIQKLSVSLDMSKIIFVLDDDPESSANGYLSKLISMGIYNFTRNKDGINYLLQHPNTYRDVAHIHQLDELTQAVTEKIIINNNTVTNSISNTQMILGVRSITEHAGATTLIYMLKKQLEVNYTVLAIEIGKRDFFYLNEKNMISVEQKDFARTLMQYKDVNIILVDLNGFAEEEAVCDDILYLIEPSTLKLNKLISRDRKIFDKLKSKKIVLNKSMLSSKDVLDFEYESKSKIFYNVPPLDERISGHTLLDDLLSKVGFSRQDKSKSSGDDKSKVFGLFKF